VTVTNNNGYAFVLDCSVTMTWIFEDERTDATDALLEILEKTKAIVPTIWPLEVANVLLFAKRKKRIKENTATDFIDALSLLPIHIDQSTTSRATHGIFLLAEKTCLTIYDACYLELAKREEIPLATCDIDLLKAAKALNIKTL